MVVPKSSKGIRVCADLKITINPHLNKEHYPLPNPRDIYASLSGGKIFTSLDLTAAYLQLPVSKNSKELLTINTPFGLFQYQRLPFGVMTVPSQFQFVIDQVLLNIPDVVCYLDNILIMAETEEECYKRTCLVLERLKNCNIKVNINKCDFFVKSLTYLGHVIDQQGLRPHENKIRALREAPATRNKQELKSYLGLLNYYGHFIQDLSSKLQPLYDLLKNNAPWKWSTKCQDIFEDSKNWICTENVLTLYNPEKPLRLICDASPYGLGAVLAHVINGDERPVSFASKTLSSAEKNYSQLEREALSIIFGLKNFHQYLFGRTFELVSDHSPLT